MGTESSTSHASPWKSQKRRLRRDGQLRTYRLANSTSAKALPIIQHSQPRRTGFQIGQPIQTQLPRYEVLQLNTREPEDEKLDQLATAPVDNSRILALTTRNRPSSLIKDHIGGLRGDPFNALPIGAQGHVASAFDYCKSKQQIPSSARHC